MRTSESISKIAPDLLKAQQAMHAAAKSATNPHFRSKYADLPAVIDAVKAALNDNGIAFLQSPTNDSTGVMVTTRLQHASGEFFEDTIYLPVPVQTAQAYGSAITYGKRYGLQAMCGLPSEDDDGQAASVPSKAADRPNTATQVAHDALADMSPDEQTFLRDHAMEIIALHEKNGALYSYIEAQKFDTEEKLALWSLLPAPVRSAIKKQSPKPALVSQA